ncbi:isopenicillin N synthase family oxygenase [Modestobacter sp. Leaf380]|uniref:isopenicillin N synthase family dioxygenase n=1 Tax=Modestobacter sp. Leaf380 TaxID=1736356 RepID=UPI0006F66397|nr:2-oxoglutarate and iron-dependent oxygenase domain-containing protein [Modestobacter sp. Leaf380]KQS66760.1 2OG-Fe(II) oxygenase [Modestobacter sp. Leaf380]
MSVVPVIDISDLSSDDEARRRAVGKEIDAACREIGFFQITGHGLDPELVTGVYDSAKAFFAQPLEAKRAVAQPDPKTVRGYTAVGEQAFAYNDDTSAPGDLHQKFDIGPVGVPDDPYFSVENAGPHFIPNQWPAEPAGMEEAWTAYFHAANDLCRTIMRGFALGLDLDEQFFAPYVDKDISMLRAIHYPHRDEPPLRGQMRAGAHTDYGSLTIVRPEEAPGGLQVFTQDGDWFDVPVIPGALVVNIGDLMAQWTNDQWISTRHRVANPPRDVVADTERMSIVFFHQPNYDAVIEALPTTVAPGEEPRYAPTTSGDHLTSKFVKTHQRV